MVHFSISNDTQAIINTALSSDGSSI